VNAGTGTAGVHLGVHPGQRVALVTGAARGIGLAISLALEQDGCHVWRLDREGLVSGDRLLRADVRVRDDLLSAVQRVVALDGGLDILVNNAGTMTTGPHLQTTPEDFQTLVDTNLGGIFHAVQVFGPHMRRGGSIVNIASVSAERGGGAVGNVWYGATKAAVVALTSGLARELGPLGVRVNAISPAVIDTDLTHAALTPEVRARTLTRLPLGRLAEVFDVADATVFLCSAAARFITGATLRVDGGFLTA
jgi:NAD(P)-dependent dehydrogenase (short-subunit alcohol dehydrogenase family)